MIDKDYIKELDVLKAPLERVVSMNQYAWKIRRSYPEETLKIANEAKELSEQLDDHNALAYSYRNSGTAYYLLSMFEQGLVDLHKALELFKKEDNKHAEATSIRTIGNIYHSIEENEKAIEFYHKAIEITKQLNDKQGTAYNLGNIGYVYQKLKQQDEALDFMLQTYELLSEIDDDLGLSDVMGNIGRTYFITGEKDKALEFYNLSLCRAEKINHLRGIATANNSLGEYFSDGGAYNKAEQHLNKSLETANKMGERLLICQILKNLSGLHEKTGDLQKALDRFKEFQTLNNEILLSDKKSSLNAIKVEAELKWSETEKELFKVKNIELANANAIIEETNRGVTDSIKYAQRIQEAILPSEELIKHLIPDSFVMYRPKDVLSGDFYWVSGARTNYGEDFILASVADCTGHGVPGALMSIIGNNYLRLCEHEETVNRPSEALDFINNGVSKTLRQELSTSAIKDGMDMSFIAIDYKSMKLHFAGAKNSIFHVHKGCLTEYKGDKQPIGSYVGEELIPFTNNEINIEKGDVVYLFSDGYPDQFGGPKGKKFMYKKYRELITTISNLPMSEQKIKLEKRFDDWKGDLEQLDDVCIFGIRI